MTGITGRSGWRQRNSRTSPFKAGPVAATGKHSTTTAKFLAQVQAAVHVQRLAGDVARWRGRQEAHGGGDVVRGAEPAGEGAADAVVVRELPIGVARGVDQAGDDAVDSDGVGGE